LCTLHSAKDPKIGKNLSSWKGEALERKKSPTHPQTLLTYIDNQRITRNSRNFLQQNFPPFAPCRPPSAPQSHTYQSTICSIHGQIYACRSATPLLCSALLCSILLYSTLLHPSLAMIRPNRSSLTLVLQRPGGGKKNHP
jgi:hypothetical protein